MTSQEVGYQHGTAFKSRIDASLRLYKPRFGGDDQWLSERAGVVCSQLQVRTPKLLEELKGIAEGSGNTLQDIVALNARTEFIRPLKTPDEVDFGESVAETPGECTTVCFPEEGVLGESWDWYQALQGLAVILDITQGKLFLKLFSFLKTITEF
jgi:isopenicillin-N N-acyltransferase-like protein